jgi:hypothetical protein
MGSRTGLASPKLFKDTISYLPTNRSGQVLV